MANPYLILWCDPSQNKIYSGWQKNTQASTPVLKQGDQIGCEIHWVRASSFTSSMQEIVFPPSATIRLAIGRLDSAPLGGTFTMSYDGDTTDALAYDITATSLQTALNDLASIAAQGGVTVSKTNNQFRIVWNDAGVYTDTITADVDMIYPTSQFSAIEARAGSATASRIILFKIKQSAIAATTSFTSVPAPSATVSSIFTNNWRISLYPYPKEGVYSITVVKGASTYTTESIPYNADGFTVASALNALDIGTTEIFSVLKSGDYIWDITSPSAVDSISVNAGLIGFSAKYGVLDMNTAEVEEFLAGSSSADCVLEVEADVDGEIQTIVQTKVNVINDLIDTSSFTVVSMGEVMPVDSVVRYDTSQALSSAQQLTARQNINAVSLTEVTDSLDLGNIPTLNEKNAMQNSVLPSTSNPFVTMSERNAFDQSLNTTDDVQFNTVTVGTNSVVIDGTSVSVSDGTDTLLVQPTGITFSDSTVQTTAAVFPDLSIYLEKDGNLSGIADISIARTNLGLGTMALETATNYLTKADNLSSLQSAATARTNLGLGTMAIETASNYLAKSDNLSGLSSVQTSRTNLGLGTSDSPQFTAAFLGGTSGNYSTASGTAISTFATGGQYVTIQPTGITANSANGFSVTVPANGDTAKIAKTGQFNGEYGIWYGASGGNQTGITKDGVRFSDGTIQTTASDGGFNSTLVDAQGTDFTRNPSGAISCDYVNLTNDVGYIAYNDGSAITFEDWVYTNIDYSGGDIQPEGDGHGPIVCSAFCSSWKSRNSIRVITAATSNLSYAVIRENDFLYLSDRETKFLSYNGTGSGGNQDGSISNNILRMDKPWKYSFNVMMVLSPLPMYSSSWTASPNLYHNGGVSSNLSDNWMYSTFGLCGYIVEKGFGTTGYSMGLDASLSGIGRFIINKANGNMLFRYPKSRRGNDYGYANTWILPTYGEFVVPLTNTEFITDGGAFCMDVEITNYANGTMNVDNSNSMKVRLEIYSPNQTSTEVIEFVINDVVSPIEIESPEGTILCARDSLCQPTLVCGVRSSIEYPARPYVDVQTNNMKFAYIG